MSDGTDEVSAKLNLLIERFDKYYQPIIESANREGVPFILVYPNRDSFITKFHSDVRHNHKPGRRNDVCRDMAKELFEYVVDHNLNLYQKSLGKLKTASRDYGRVKPRAETLWLTKNLGLPDAAYYNALYRDTETEYLNFNTHKPNLKDFFEDWEDVLYDLITERTKCQSTCESAQSNLRETWRYIRGFAGGAAVVITVILALAVFFFGDNIFEKRQPPKPDATPSLLVPPPTTGAVVNHSAE